MSVTLVWLELVTIKICLNSANSNNYCLLLGGNLTKYDPKKCPLLGSGRFYSCWGVSYKNNKWINESVPSKEASLVGRLLIGEGGGTVLLG